MADWPELHAVNGVLEALNTLAGKYRMVIATNAQDSGTPKITAANQRVGIDSFFERIYTAREMGRLQARQSRTFKRLPWIWVLIPMSYS